MATSKDYGLGDYAFPRSWFAVASSHEVGRKPISVRYLGQDMVLYRGESGRVVALEAYCPHMGTHIGLAPNSHTSQSAEFMEGDNIRCPFHAWRFGPDGVCNHIPYHDGPIPPKATLKAWMAQERYGIVFIWNDPEGLAPDFDLPVFPEWDDSSYVRWEGLEYLQDLFHPIEVFDNMSDVAHLHHLHGTKCDRYENELGINVMHQRQTSLPVGNHAGEIGTGRLTTIAGYAGTGVAFGWFEELQAWQIICATPIEDGTSRFWQMAMVKRRPGMSDDQARRYRDTISREFAGGLLRDGEVWKTKRAALQIMQMPGDGPFRQSRIWYSQFFNPRVKAAEIVGRVKGIHTAKGVAPFTQTVTAAE